MPQKNRNRKLARAAVWAAFGVFMVLAGDASAASAEDDDDAPFDERMMRKFLRAIGLRNGQEAGIEYHERPPLVVPPTRTLPPPAAGDSLIANNPAWPTDPDEKRRKAEQKAKKERKPVDWLADVQHDRMTPEDIAAGKTNNPTAPSPANPRPSAGPSGGAAPEMTPEELGYKTTLWDNITSLGGLTNSFKTEKPPEYGKFVREPPRAVLTDPPAGYRTPSPSQPYGLNAKDTAARAAAPVDPQTVRGAQ
jgi:hypothetical protein